VVTDIRAKGVCCPSGTFFIVIIPLFLQRELEGRKKKYGR
jgi:hypothetical protein